MFDAVGDIVLCMSQLQLSARAYHRILKLARTIADLAGSDETFGGDFAVSSEIDHRISEKNCIVQKTPGLNTLNRIT